MKTFAFVHSAFNEIGERIVLERKFGVNKVKLKSEKAVTYQKVYFSLKDLRACNYEILTRAYTHLYLGFSNYNHSDYIEFS